MVGGRRIKLDLSDDDSRKWSDEDSRKWSDEESQDDESTYCPLSVQEELDYLRKEVIRLEQQAHKMKTDNSFLRQRNDDLMASMETFANEEILALEEKLAFQDEEITMLTHQLEIQETHFQMQLEVVAPTHIPHTKSLTCGVCYRHVTVIIPNTKGGCLLCSSHQDPRELPIDDFPIQSALSFMKKMN
jgi:predicted RNase H-like nuclease (RuvC/YqgF family)